MDAFARQLAAPVPNLAPVPDYTHDPAEGVQIDQGRTLVRLTSNPAAQGGGVPFAPTRPARMTGVLSLRPFMQWVAHGFVRSATHVEIARRPSNTPGFANLAGSMQPAYQPAVTNPGSTMPWDKVRLGPTPEAS